MSEGQKVSVAIDEAAYQRVLDLALRGHKTVDDVLEEAVARYESEELRRTDGRERFGRIIDEMRQQAARAGTDKMTMEEIDAEIAEARRGMKERAGEH